MKPLHATMKGPGPVGTLMSAHLYAVLLVMSPYDAPSQISNGESHSCAHA